MATHPAAEINRSLNTDLATDNAQALRPYRLGTHTPRALVHPDSAEQTARVLALAAERGWAVVPWGSGAGQACGDIPRRYDVALATTRMANVLDADPDNLTVSAQAGIRLGELNRQLRAHRLFLPLGLGAERRTLGGVIAANRLGFKRLLYGDPRDNLLGMGAALPNGEVVRYGRKVIKNVAGYDMNKLYLGSQGLLGVLVEATFKIYPLADREGYLVAGFKGGQGAAQAAQALFGSSLNPSCLILLLGCTVEQLRANPAMEVPHGKAVLVAGFDGRIPVVNRQLEDGTRILLSKHATGVAAMEGLAADITAMIEDPSHGADPRQERVLLRLGVLPDHVADAMAQAVGTMNIPGTEFGIVADYSAGSIELLLTGEPHIGWERMEGRIQELRRAVGERHGTVVLAAAPPILKASVSAWGDLSGEGRIMQRIKAQLDPHHIMAPGRFLPDAHGLN